MALIVPTVAKAGQCEDNFIEMESAREGMLRAKTNYQYNIAFDNYIRYNEKVRQHCNLTISRSAWQEKQRVLDNHKQRITP